MANNQDMVRPSLQDATQRGGGTTGKHVLQEVSIHIYNTHVGFAFTCKQKKENGANISLRNIYTNMPTGMIYLKVCAWVFLYFITRNGNKEGFKEKNPADNS